jgi:hypothetical protein
MVRRRAEPGASGKTNTSVTERLAAGRTTPLLPTSSGSSLGEPGNVDRSRMPSACFGTRRWSAISTSPRLALGVAQLTGGTKDPASPRRSYISRAIVRTAQEPVIARRRSGAVRTVGQVAARAASRRRSPGMSRGELDFAACQSSTVRSTNPPDCPIPKLQPCSQLPKTDVFESRLVLQSGTPPSPILWELHSRK